MVSARTQSGFTLIELLLVAALIGILTSVLIVIINVPGQFAKVRDAQRKNDLSNLQKVLELYYNDKNSYPQALSDIVGSSYIREIPQDPKAGYSYRYEQESGGQGYQLYAGLERCQSASNCNDPQACNGGNACSGAGGTCGNAVCTYGVASSNLSP